MTTPKPQSFFDALAAQFRVISATCMPALVTPTVNSALAAQIPSFYKALCNDLSHAADDDLHALHAGLWLLADDLSTAHTICQDVPTSFGSAWHAVMHRREGDFSNSKYWWHRVSGITWDSPLHQVNSTLLAAASSDAWRANLAHYDPAAFVDLVEQYHRKPDAARSSLLLQIQRLEWLSLFLENFHQASSEP